MKKLLFFLLTVTTYNAVTAQNVGIGTTTPTDKLHVAGNIKGDTLKPNAIKLPPNAGSGKILTSDAVGNASWQSSSLVAGNVGYGVWGDCATNGNISEYQPAADTTGAANDYLGNCVSISGNFAFAGAEGDDVGANLDQGSVNIYQWNGTAWVFFQKITDATGQSDDFFGSSVAISGNYAIVGARRDNDGANAQEGSASIYQYNGTSWVLMQKITATGGAAYDYFGSSVSISDNYAIIGAPGDDIGVDADQGSASIYHYNGTSWVYMVEITDAGGLANDEFGKSVCISGIYAIVGIPYYDDGSNLDEGSANFYRYNGANWVLMQKVTGVLGLADDRFGTSVSISGNYAIIGCPYDEVGANENQGSALFYQYNGSSWVLMQKITDVSGAAGDEFGSSVSISGNYALVGVLSNPFAPIAPSPAIFQRVGAGWQKLQTISDPGGVKADYFGSAVAINGVTKRFVIGASGYVNHSGKIVFGKVN